MNGRPIEHVTELIFVGSTGHDSPLSIGPRGAGLIESGIWVTIRFDVWSWDGGKKIYNRRRHHAQNHNSAGHDPLSEPVIPLR